MGYRHAQLARARSREVELFERNQRLEQALSDLQEQRKDAYAYARDKLPYDSPHRPALMRILEMR